MDWRDGKGGLSKGRKDCAPGENASFFFDFGVDKCFEEAGAMVDTDTDIRDEKNQQRNWIEPILVLIFMKGNEMF